MKKCDLYRAKKGNNAVNTVAHAVMNGVSDSVIRP